MCVYEHIGVDREHRSAAPVDLVAEVMPRQEDLSWRSPPASAGPCLRQDARVRRETVCPDPLRCLLGRRGRGRPVPAGGARRGSPDGAEPGVPIAVPEIRHPHGTRGPARGMDETALADVDPDV